MRQVQEALKDIGIPVMAGVWRATSANQNPPAQYAVYSTPRAEKLFKCWSIGRTPKSQPPGSGTFEWWKRPSSAPMK